MTDEVQQIMALVDDYSWAKHQGFGSAPILRADIKSRLREVVAPTVPEPGERDAERLAFLVGSDTTTSMALVQMELRKLNGDCPTLDEWRTAIDQAIAALPTEATHTQPASEPKWVALPYRTPTDLRNAFKSGTKFVLHYHGKSYEVTHMQAQERVCFVQPPGMPVKVYPDGRNCESAGDAIWLEQVSATPQPAAKQAEPVALNGWVMVPVEPTSDMLAAMSREWHSSRHGPARKQYAAMLAAAPTQPRPQLAVIHLPSDDTEGGLV